MCVCVVCTSSFRETQRKCENPNEKVTYCRMTEYSEAEHGDKITENTKEKAKNGLQQNEYW